jgi:hypothetical protein
MGNVWYLAFTWPLITEGFETVDLMEAKRLLGERS